MEAQDLATTNVVGRNVDTSDFNLSNCMPLHRSSTSELNGLDGPKPKRLRRSSSNGILSENLQKRLPYRAGQHELRLPSFEELGISARFLQYSPFTARPDLPQQSQNHSRSVSPPPISPRPSDLLRRSPRSAPAPSTSHFLCSTHGLAFPLTPPDEKPALDFQSQSEAVPHSQSTCQSQLTELTPTMSTIQDQGITAVSTSGDASTSSAAEGHPEALDTMPESSGALPTALNEQNETAPSSSLDDGIHASVSTIANSGVLGDTYRILSQTLPCPPTVSALEVSPPFSPVYIKVVEAIQARLQPGKSPYVDITHAMPPKSTLSSLPQSPPSTPGFPAGEDYFSTNVFSRAAPVPSYHDSHGLLNASAPSSPAPLVPPSSVHVACIERYIPPSSVQEVNDLLSASGPSVLLDRLIELSPNGGNLIFLLPTKKGALAFKNEYLGPILDPLLRHIVTVNSLSTDVASSLGKVSAVDAMHDFEGLKRKLNTVCRRLNRPVPTASSHAPTPANSGEYTLVHASAGVMPLARSLWSEWWVVQEQQRIKDVLSMYWRAAQRLPVDKAVTSSSLWRDILEGVKMRAYEREEEPCNGIEMGVFVIRRVK